MITLEAWIDFYNEFEQGLAFLDFLEVLDVKNEYRSMNPGRSLTDAEALSVLNMIRSGSEGWSTLPRKVIQEGIEEWEAS